MNSESFTGEIQGEFVVDLESFRFLKTKITYKNSRNAVAGWLKNQQQGAAFIKKYATLVCFDALAVERARGTTKEKCD
ncbi:hypothetical protein ACM91F_27860 [Escherichia coli]